MVSPTPSTTATPSSFQARNLSLLVAAQALGGASPPIIISLGGLVGQQLSSNPTATTLPVSIYQLGLALSTLPAAWLMQRLGRRWAYVLGAVLGVVSGIIAAQGIAQSDFVTFCIGTALAGFYAACVQSYRFAAADAVGAPHLQAKAISRIMVGGLIAAIIGPQVVIWTRDALPATPFAGSFYSQAALAALALPILQVLSRPGLQKQAIVGTARPLTAIGATPRFIEAAAAGVVVLALIFWVASGWLGGGRSYDNTRIRIAEVKRGDLVRDITADGRVITANSPTLYAIAGGIVLFLIGVRMIFPRPEGLMGETPGGEPFIVPLAIPLIAGPSGMAAVMLMGSNEPHRLGEWSLALLLAWAATAAIRRCARLLYRLRGRRALSAVERLMGMLLVAISVQMLLDGLATYLKSAM